MLANSIMNTNPAKADALRLLGPSALEVPATTSAFVPPDKLLAYWVEHCLKQPEFDKLEAGCVKARFSGKLSPVGPNLSVLVQLRGLVESLGNASMNAGNGGLVGCVLACGLYPLVGRMLPMKAKHGARRATVITAKDEKVQFHHPCMCCAVHEICAASCCCNQARLPWTS